jgi:DNA-binding LytR/AlgR family response regulator
MVNSNGGFCELESGLRIPVSRRRAAAVQAAFDDYQSQRRAA